MKLFGLRIKLKRFLKIHENLIFGIIENFKRIKYDLCFKVSLIVFSLLGV